ncbi:MAG: hypothetical protein K1X67_04595 [Fimbriimonadaceae bacterium]|nr:hypothetical protein [Fimbriimonadaceae bacterium]
MRFGWRLTKMSELVDRFRASMNIDYEKWHDGIGYDIDLIPQMSPKEIAEVERIMLGRGVMDWRDLEALDALGTIRSLDLIDHTRAHGSAELKVHAMRYGRPLDAKATEDGIIEGLRNTEFYGGLTQALDQAAESDSPRVQAELFRMARDKVGDGSYQAVAILYARFGKISSQWDFSRRDFFLRFVGPVTEDRKQAFLEMCAELGVDPDQACQA